MSLKALLKGTIALDSLCRPGGYIYNLSVRYVFINSIQAVNNEFKMFRDVYVRRLTLEPIRTYLDVMAKRFT